MIHLSDFSYVVRIIKSITDSALVCPTLLCEVFYSLKEAAVKYFPEQQDAVKRWDWLYKSCFTI